MKNVGWRFCVYRVTVFGNLDFARTDVQTEKTEYPYKKMVISERVRAPPLSEARRCTRCDRIGRVCQSLDALSRLRCNCARHVAPRRRIEIATRERGGTRSQASQNRRRPAERRDGGASRARVERSHRLFCPRPGFSRPILLTLRGLPAPSRAPLTLTRAHPAPRDFAG